MQIIKSSLFKKISKIFGINLIIMLILLNIKVTMSDPSNSNSGLSFLGLDVNLFETANAAEYIRESHAVVLQCGRSGQPATIIICEYGGYGCVPKDCN